MFVRVDSLRERWRTALVLPPSLGVIQLIELRERAVFCVETEIAGVQNLDAGYVIAIERRLSRASGVAAVCWISEPQPQVVHVHGRRGRIGHCVDSGVRLSSGPTRGREHESLAAKDAGELRTATPALIGVDVALIPGHAERARRDLQNEQREGRIRRETLDLDLHPVVRARRVDRHMPLNTVGVWQTARRSRGHL